MNSNTCFPLLTVCSWNVFSAYVTFYFYLSSSTLYLSLHSVQRICLLFPVINCSSYRFIDLLCMCLLLKCQYDCPKSRKASWLNSFYLDPAGWVSRPPPSCAEWSNPTGPAVFWVHCLASAQLDLDLDYKSRSKSSSELPDSESNSSKSGPLFGKQSDFCY